MTKMTILLSMLLFLALMVSSLEATDRTITIDAATLASIRSAIITDPLISAYWDFYTQTTREDEPDPPFDGERAFTNSFGLESKAILLYQRVIRNDPPSHGWNTSIDHIRNDLYSFPWQTYQMALHHPLIEGDYPQEPVDGETIPSWWDVTQTEDSPWTWFNLKSYNRGRELSYNLIFMAFMIDMLYYTRTTPEHLLKMQSIINNFNAHLTWIRSNFLDYDNWNGLGWKDGNSIIQPMGLCYDGVGDDEDDVPYCMPLIGNDVNRYVLICGLGYGAIVTGATFPGGALFPQNVDFDNSDSLINFVKNEFVSSIELPTGSGCYGMNDYLVTKTGMYIGGITYQNRLLYLTPLFLTALNRVHGINLYNSSNAWNCDLVPKMVKNVLVRIDPELQHILQEDDWRFDGIDDEGSIDTRFDHSRQIERGLLSYYYQNTDEPEVRENIRWYVKRLYERNSDLLAYLQYPREAWEHDFKSSFMVVISYRPEADAISGGGSLPQHYSNRNYSNSELTILRNPMTASDDLDYLTSGFKNMNLMTINHENSFAFSHKNDDKTSFQLYLEGKPVIIEGGYRPKDSWKEWFRNASSHNLLLINPGLPTTGSNSEDDYLAIGYETPGMHGASMQFEDPSSPIIYG